MAVLALAGAGSAIGASIGGTFLGMSASSIGWMAGSFLGQLLFAEKTHTYGPRLKGDRFTGSALGQVRPIVWGTCKVEGKIIWQTPYHEHEHTEDSGGKGGGSEYTSYTYTRSFAILLCEGQIEAVRRVWINGKLEFDWSENSNVAADMQSGTKVGDIKFYYGSDTQLPDPTMESFDGAGNVPAYRGTAYMVFNEYDVTDTSGACPVVEVEVVANASLATQSALGVVLAGGDNWGQIGYVNEGVLYYQVEAQAGATTTFDVIGVDLSNGNRVFTQTFTQVIDSSPSGYQRGPVSDDQYNWYLMGSGFHDDIAGQEVAMITIGVKLQDGGVATLTGELYGTDGEWIQIANFGGWDDNGTMQNFLFKRGVYQTYLYATSVDDNADDKRWIQRWDMPSYYAEKRYDFADGGYHLACYPADDGDVYLYNGNDHKLYLFDLDLNLIESRALPGSINPPDLIAYSDGILWCARSLGGASGNGIVEAYNIEDFSAIGSVSNLTYGVSVRNARTYSMYASGSSVAITIDDKLWTVQTRRVTRQSATLSDIVANLHQRAGQTSDDYDVAALTDEVRGFLVSEQVSVRSCIESLQLGFLFDARDTGGKIQHVKRGGASVATLTVDDLGAYENEPVSEWILIRQQEEELPQTLTINYMDYDGSYEKSAQNATRQAVLAGDITTFQVPIVFTDDEAQEVVSKHMYEAWEARTKYKFTTNMEWAKLEPCDPVTVRGKQLRLTQRNDGINGIVEYEAVGYIPEIYTQVGVGSSSSGYTEETIEARGPTVFEILDVPPLADADYNTYIEYAAATGVLDGWPSAAIMRSDSGDSYSLVSLIASASTMGFATTALGDWDGGNVFDEGNTVTVRLYGSATLSSVTFDQAVNMEFPFLLGNELIFGRDATLVSTGVYKISGLLRGRMGTEAYMSTHAINDRFVVLSASNLRRFTPRDADFNTERFFKGVTSQNKISNAIPKAHTYAGNNLKPLTPVHIGGGTAGISTSWTIQWVGRTRYRWQWLDSVDAGSDEATNDFEVRVYNDPDSPTTVLRTITVTNATASGGFFSTTYSNANQVTDFGSHQRRIAVSVRKIGADRNSEWSDITSLNSGYATTSVVLLHMDGANGSTTFTDVYTHSFTAFGNAQISTAQSKFGGAAGLFDGTGDYISTAASNEFNFGTGDFTIECQVRTSQASGNYIGVLALNVSGQGHFRLSTRHGGSNNLAFNFNDGGYVDITTGFSVNDGAWHHIAVTRSAGVFRIFADGVLKATDSGNLTKNIGTSSNAFVVGFNAADTLYYDGYVDEVRIKKGEAMWTSNFTPPTSAYTE